MYVKVHVFKVTGLYFDRECFRFRFDIYPVKNFKIISNLFGSWLVGKRNGATSLSLCQSQKIIQQVIVVEEVTILEIEGEFGSFH